MATKTSQEFKIGEGGWCLYAEEDLEVPVYVRFGMKDTRLEVRAMHLASEERITGTTLRSIPLARIEAIANSPTFREEIREAVQSGVEAAFDLVGRVEWLVPESKPNALLIWDKRIYVARWTREKSPSDASPTRSNEKKPDEFYVEIATRHTDLLRTYRNPAARLAEERGVQLVTVHRWLREARRRGLVGESSKSRGRSER